MTGKIANSSQILTGTWLPPQYAKQLLLKFTLWTYLPSLRRPHNSTDKCDKQITNGVKKNEKYRVQFLKLLWLFITHLPALLAREILPANDLPRHPAQLVQG